VLLLAYGSRGDVEPLAGLAVRLRALGADGHPLRGHELSAGRPAVAAPPPQARPGRSFPPDVTGNRVLWDLDAQDRS
jgi:hypothetical protein